MVILDRLSGTKGERWTLARKLKAGQDLCGSSTVSETIPHPTKPGFTEIPLKIGWDCPTDVTSKPGVCQQATASRKTLFFKEEHLHLQLAKFFAQDTHNEASNANHHAAGHRLVVLLCGNHNR